MMKKPTKSPPAPPPKQWSGLFHKSSLWINVRIIKNKITSQEDAITSDPKTLFTNSSMLIHSNGGCWWWFLATVQKVLLSTCFSFQVTLSFERKFVCTTMQSVTLCKVGKPWMEQLHKVDICETEQYLSAQVTQTLAHRIKTDLWPLWSTWFCANELTPWKKHWHLSSEKSKKKSICACLSLCVWSYKLVDSAKPGKDQLAIMTNIVLFA